MRGTTPGHSVVSQVVIGILSQLMKQTFRRAVAWVVCVVRVVVRVMRVVVLVCVVYVRSTVIFASRV